MLTLYQAKPPRLTALSPLPRRSVPPNFKRLLASHAQDLNHSFIVVVLSSRFVILGGC
jgi:hypothetical protein